jgi:uncharacterized DUF497 family protein
MARVKDAYLVACERVAKRRGASFENIQNIFLAQTAIGFDGQIAAEVEKEFQDIARAGNAERVQ